VREEKQEKVINKQQQFDAFLSFGESYVIVANLNIEY
jgi:hypothetical protein